MARIGEIALAETIRRLGEQQAALSSLRGSAGTVLGASTIGSAFLAGIALDRSSTLGVLGWMALLGTASTAIVVLLILLPVDFGAATDVEILKDERWHAADEDVAALTLAEFLSERAEVNSDSLDKHWRLLTLATSTTTVSILCWIGSIARTEGNSQPHEQQPEPPAAATTTTT